MRKKLVRVKDEKETCENKEQHMETEVGDRTL